MNWSPAEHLARATLAGALSLVLFAPAARADDPACAVRTSNARIMFQSAGPVEFGPGWSGTLGSGMFGARYNFLLMGDYAWQMPGEMRARWPPEMRIAAVGDMQGGSLTVQYGLRLQFWLSVLGTEFMIPIPMWVGTDRSERGMSRFTPWAWTGTDTAVTVTAHERLLREDTLMVPVLNSITYRLWGSYELTTTVRTREIAFPQANTGITEMNPEADVPPTANGDLNMPARWLGSLRYVGSLRLRLEVRYPLCIPGTSICSSRTDTVANQAIPFASATEQQMSVDRSVRLPAPGATASPEIEADFGDVRLGLSGRQDITLRNTGTLTTLFTPQAPADRAFQVPTDPLCVPGGQTRTLTVRFMPDRAGRYDSVLNIATTAPAMPALSLRLTGNGADPSSPLRDGGTSGRDAAVSSRDGAVQTNGDGGVVDDEDAGDPQGEGGTVIEGTQGCGCRTPARTPGSGPALVLFGLAALLRRRRR
ncbi:MAG: MYXO-CTERM sorting domain-containing protein [Polyangiales bacterium]